MKFKSKIGLEIIIPLILIFGSIGWHLFNDRLWIGLAIILSVFVFIMFVFSTTYYVIEKNALLVRCSFFSVALLIFMQLLKSVKHILL